MVTATERDREQIPINELAKTNQWVIQVNQLLKVDLKQCALWLLRFTLWAHQIFPVIIMISTTSENIIPDECRPCR
jgi:hypothetical protein